MEIEHFHRITGTPALPLAVRGWHELIEDGHSDGNVLVAWDHSAIVAFDHSQTGAKKAIGVLTWCDQDWLNQFWIFLAYVVPERRRGGVHTAMFNALADKAREVKRPRIGSGALLGNSVSRSAMRAQSRVEVGVLTRFDVTLD